MSPAGLLAPELAEVVTHGIVGRLVECLVCATAEFVVSLGDLPDCEFVSFSFDEFKLSRIELTVRINRNGLTPAQTHQTNTICNFGTNTLKLQ